MALRTPLIEQYEQDVVVLDGGLDYVTSPSMVKPGVLKECLNYEIVDRSGLRRIDGYYRWDGGGVIASDIVYVINGELNDVASLTGGEYLCVQNSEPFGIYASSTSTSITYIRIDPTKEPIGGDKVTCVSDGSFDFTMGTDDPRPITDVSYTHVQELVPTFYKSGNLGNGPRLISLVPQGTLNARPDGYNNIVGLKYFKDRLYSIIDCCYITGTCSTQLYPNDMIGDSVLLNPTLTSGTWSSGTFRSDVLNVEPYFQNSAGNFRRAMYGLGGADLARTGGAVANVSYSSNGGIALLHRSYTEAQAMNSGELGKVTVATGGSGYTSAPAVTITGGGGYGATARAVISGGAVSYIYLVDRGRGYTSAPTVTVQAPPAGVTAKATASLMTWDWAGTRNLNTGWSVAFNKGTSLSGGLSKVDRQRSVTGQVTTFTTPLTANNKNGTCNKILNNMDFDTAIQSAQYSWIPSSGTYFDPSFVSTTDTSGVQTLIRDVAANTTYESQTIGFVDFANIVDQLPKGALIRGFEATIVYDTTGGFSGAHAGNKLILRGTLFKSTNIDTVADSARTETRLSDRKALELTVPTGAVTDQTVTLGGSTDLWGTSGLKTEDITKNFGIGIDLFVNKGSGITFDFSFRIDNISLKVYYADPTVRYYFSDGSNKISADLVSYSLSAGDWTRGDATGYMQLGNVTIHTTNYASAKPAILSGWSIYADSGLTVKVGETTADMTYNGLDNLTAIQAKKSRYEFVNANFYEDADWDGLYGVSGAGRAFYYDGTFFSRIYAIGLAEPDSSTKDIPRHIEAYRYHLALGYKQGTVLFSVPAEPENFNTFEGAGYMSVGDSVTGLSSLPGEYLAVFAQNSIWGITGKTVDEFSLQNISPNSGCIEYTLANMGNRPIYCDVWGISTLNQSQEYGNFLGQRLSSQVTPFLRPRLQKYGQQYSGNEAVAIVAAYIVRSKNQYRLWFSDGYQLVMSMVGPDQIPQFTKTRFLAAASTGEGTPVFDLTDSIYPLAITSEIDEFGVEQIMFSMDCTKSLQPVYNSFSASVWNFIYKIDYLASMGDVLDFNVTNSDTAYPVAIPANFTTVYWTASAPFQSKTLCKVRTEGLTRGVGSMTAMAFGEYDDKTPNDYIGGNVSLPYTAQQNLTFDFYPESTLNEVQASGRVLSIRIDNFTSSNKTNLAPTGATPEYWVPSSVEPPHVVQLLLLHFEKGAEDA